MRKYLFFLTIALFTITKQNLFSQNSDLSVVLYESSVNKVLKAIGSFSGENEYKTFFKSGKYKWTATDAKVTLLENKARFTSNIKVEVGTFSYTDEVEGEIKVSYNQQKNKLELKLETAIFEIYTKVLGQKIVVKRIDLADFYKDPLEFDGPLAYQSEMPFSMPDNTIKKIAAKIKKCTILVQQTKIIMNAELDFFEVE
ncbi:MAG: hypothetical protein PHD97_01585 [Bacteroidales bacterium]|nr:hypothetical protein [Bacteroidales bacterium]